jgi:hypothetical protein
VANAA